MVDEDSIERDFLATALRWSEFLRRGKSSERANWEYDRLYQLFKEGLRLLPDRGEAALKRIAASDDTKVRSIAATALLAIDEPFATGLLQEIVNRNAAGSFTAKTTLREWKKGRMRDYRG